MSTVTMIWMLVHLMGDFLQEDLTIVLGQTSPNTIIYGLDVLKGEAVVFKNHQRSHHFEIPFKNSIQARQVNDHLWLWDPQSFEGLSNYDSMGKVQKVPLNVPFTPAIIEPLGDGYLVVSFQDSQLSFEHKDSKGVNVSSEQVSRKKLPMINAGKPMQIVKILDQFWIWSPLHRAVFKLEQNGKIAEVLDAPTTTLERFDPGAPGSYMEIEDKGDRQLLTRFLAQHKGLILSITPVGLIERDGGPVFVFNLLFLGTTLRTDGKAFWFRETVFEDLQGTVLKTCKDMHYRGQLDGKILAQEYQPNLPKPQMKLFSWE